MKPIICIFLLLSSIGFSNEILQGTLKNGMRYYFLPRAQSEPSAIRLIVKKPKELCRQSAVIDPFVKNRDILLQGYWFCHSEVDHLIYTYQGYLSQSSLTDTLSLLFSNPLAKQSLPDSLIEELKMEYKKEPVPPAIRQVFEIVWDGDFEYVDRLFTQDNHIVNQAYHALFEPSRMAIIVEGPFEGLNIVEMLENTLGKIVGDGRFLAPMNFKPGKSVAFVVPAENAMDCFSLDHDEEQNLVAAELIYLYSYQLAPTYKDQVINDLCFCTGFDEDAAIYDGVIGKLRPVIFLPSLQRITASAFDPSTFNAAKEELQEKYHNSRISNVDSCMYHFLSKIPDKLALNHRNLLHELELITFSEYCSFIKAHFHDVSVHTIDISADE